MCRIAKERVDSVLIGLQAVNEQPEDIRNEILAEFKKTGNAPEAICIITARRKEIRDAAELAAKKVQHDTQAETAEARVNEVLPPPENISASNSSDEEPARTLAFTVTAPLPKLRALKQFLDDGGYIYE